MGMTSEMGLVQKGGSPILGLESRGPKVGAESFPELISNSCSQGPIQFFIRFAVLFLDRLRLGHNFISQKDRLQNQGF